nr:DUF881 domain-containing protein [Bacillus pakistanensis]
MLAIQFQTVKEPVVRDTRDIWELREAILKEKETYSALYQEIRSIDQKLEKYETEKQDSQEEALRETLEELKTEAGLTEKQGAGIILTVQPVLEEVLMGEKISTVSPDLLERLVNELNRFKAQDISIDGHRMINTTVIRDINGVTKIDGYSLEEIPFEIRVLTKDFEDAEKLYNQLKASQSIEDFFIDNLRVNISKPINHLTLPAYEDSIRVKRMEPVKKGGE